MSGDLSENTSSLCSYKSEVCQIESCAALFDPLVFQWQSYYDDEKDSDRHRNEAASQDAYKSKECSEENDSDSWTPASGPILSLGGPDYLFMSLQPLRGC